jgi:hypothetical protein
MERGRALRDGELRHRTEGTEGTGARCARQASMRDEGSNDCGNSATARSYPRLFDGVAAWKAARHDELSVPSVPSVRCRCRIAMRRALPLSVCFAPPPKRVHAGGEARSYGKSS